MRLIDADALYEQAANTAEDYCGFFNDMEKVISARNIEQAPTIDAVPVVHGEWLRTPTGWAYCSVCGCEPPQETNATTRFCPNCGAKMTNGGTEE